MVYPNKIFTLEYKGDNQFDGKSHFVIVVAASNGNLAEEYVKQKIGFDSNAVWLMNAVYPTIWTRDGSKPEQIQAKILFNGSFRVNQTCENLSWV